MYIRVCTYKYNKVCMSVCMWVYMNVHKWLYRYHECNKCTWVYMNVHPHEHTWVCMSVHVHGCAWVYMGVRECSYMGVYDSTCAYGCTWATYRCTWVCMGVHEYTCSVSTYIGVCESVKCTWVYMGVHDVYMDARGCTWPAGSRNMLSGFKSICNYQSKIQGFMKEGAYFNSRSLKLGNAMFQKL